MDSIEVHAYDPYFRQLRRILKCVNLDGNILKCFEVLIVASLKYSFKLRLKLGPTWTPMYLVHFRSNLK